MDYSILRKIVGANGCNAFAITSDIDSKDIPILGYLREILEDNILIRNEATEQDVYRLYKVCLRVYSDYIVDLFKEKELKKFLTSSSYYNYTLNLGYYYREPTVGELKNGVRGIEASKRYTLTKEREAQAYLLMWAKTGKLRYYALAGYQYKTTGDSKQIADETYKLVMRVIDELENALDWWESSDRYTDVNVALKQHKVAMKYEFPSYAEDEVLEEISVKQLIHRLTMARDKCRLSETGVDMYKLNRLLFKQNNKSKPLNYSKFYSMGYEPYEISELRDMYNLIFPNSYEIDFKRLLKGDTEEKTQLQIDCEAILKARDSHKFSGTEFVFRIIETFEKYGYKKCSDKQRAIIDEALKKVEDTENKIENNESKEQNKLADDMESIIMQDSIFGMFGMDSNDPFGFE